MPRSSDNLATTYIQLLKEVAVAANEAISVDAALLLVLQSICRITGWPVGHAFKLREGRLHSSGIWHVDEHFSDDALRAFRQATEEQCFASGIGLPGRVLAEGRPLGMSDARTEATFRRKSSAKQAGLTAGFAFPVHSGYRITAVLEFYAPTPQQLTPELLEIMTQVGVQVGQVFEREAAQSALQASEQRSRHAGYAFIAINAQGVVTAWNKASEKIFGWPRAEVIGHMVSDILAPVHHREAHRRGLEHFVSHGNALINGQRLELPVMHRDGREFPVEIKLWSFKENHEWSFFAFAHDITARIEVEEDLEHRALHDSLTGLPNRTLVLDRLRQCLSRRDASNTGLAVLFIDLDHFKRINDSFGHDAGDQVLVTVAQRLQSTMRPSDTVARLAGDEFVVVCPEVDVVAAGRRCSR